MTNLIRTAASEPLFGSTFINSITGEVRERLKADPQPTITFKPFCGDPAGPSERANVRVEFHRQDWEQLLAALEVAHCGFWDEDSLRYEARLSDGSLYDVSADAEANEVRVVFW